MPEHMRSYYADRWSPEIDEALSTVRTRIYEHVLYEVDGELAEDFARSLDDALDRYPGDDGTEMIGLSAEHFLELVEGHGEELCGSPEDWFEGQEWSTLKQRLEHAAGIVLYFLGLAEAREGLTELAEFVDANELWDFGLTDSNPFASFAHMAETWESSRCCVLTYSVEPDEQSLGLTEVWVYEMEEGTKVYLVGKRGGDEAEEGEEE